MGLLPMRLNKYLALCGVGSRRKVEEFIFAGRVICGGYQITEPGYNVPDGQIVTVDDIEVRPEKKIYMVLHKPRGYICAVTDRHYPVILDLLPQEYDYYRLFPVGRLDLQSEGLLMLTNDGDFAAKLSHPSSQIEKEYIVETSQDVTEETARLLEKGIRVDNVFYKCVRCEVLKPRKIKIILIEGKNREIRKMLESQNIGTRSLVRVRIGNVNLDDLRPGEHRDLTEREVKGLLSLCRD